MNEKCFFCKSDMESGLTIHFAELEKCENAMTEVAIVNYMDMAA